MCCGKKWLIGSSAVIAALAIAVSVAVLLGGCGPEEPGAGGAPQSGGEAKPESGAVPVEPAPAETGPGTISGVALFSGETIPEMSIVEVTTDVEHCGKKVKTENRIVNAANRGLKNVVVTVEGVEVNGDPPQEVLTVANKGCAFVPHVSAAMVNTRLRVTNEDPINHTTHPYLNDRQSLFNVPLAPGQEPLVRPLRRKGVVKLKCDVHDWMLGWVVVHDSPYFAVTDVDGKFSISGVPAGTYTVKAWHEDLGSVSREVTVEADREAKLKLSFEEGKTAAESTAEAVEIPAPVASTEESPIPGQPLPLGLDPYMVKIPEDNPLTVEKIELGKILYFDPRLSKDDTVSCASCHHPEKGWSNAEAFATGVDGQVGGRASPPVHNRIFSDLQFWDGRAASLEDQALGPIQNPIEMGMTMPVALEKLEKIEGYPELFEKAFGSSEITADRVAKAIASFERTVVSGNSPWDRYEQGDDSALDEAEKRGLALFRGKAKCSVCHTGFNLTDEKYHNIGVGMDKAEPDLGRASQTKNEEDTGAFKTPTLRDIALTAPYFHDGSAETLMEVVEFYDKGGTPNPYLSENIQKLNLTDQEKADLVAFMKALTGETRTVVTAPELPGT